MSKVKIWENMVDYCNLSVPMLEMDIVNFGPGHNDTWTLQLKNSVLMIPKGQLVVEVFEDEEDDE